MPEDVDPRFDPVFQKGYDPARHRTRVKPVPAPAPHAQAQAQSAPQPRQVPFAPHDPSIRPVPSDAEPSPDDPGRIDPDENEPPRRNPFRLALLVFSLAAIAGAAAILWRRIASDPYQGYGGYGGDVAKIFLDQFADAAMAPLLTGGLLGLCLWFALGALRRRDDG